MASHTLFHAITSPHLPHSTDDAVLSAHRRGLIHDDDDILFEFITQTWDVSRICRMSFVEWILVFISIFSLSRAPHMSSQCRCRCFRWWAKASRTHRIRVYTVYRESWIIYRGNDRREHMMQDRIHSLKSIISEHYRMFETMKFSLALKPALDIWSKSLIFNWFVISTRVRVINELFSCSRNVVRRSIYRWHHKSRHLSTHKVSSFVRRTAGVLMECWDLKTIKWLAFCRYMTRSICCTSTLCCRTRLPDRFASFVDCVEDFMRELRRVTFIKFHENENQFLISYNNTATGLLSMPRKLVTHLILQNVELKRKNCL